jgi:hypothetical protein
MSRVEGPESRGNAKSLKSLQPAELAQFDWAKPEGSPGGTITLEPKVRTEVTAAAFKDALERNPDLLNRTVADAARYINVPPTALRAAFDQLAAQTGVKLTNPDGKARTMQAILSDVPASQGNKLLNEWVKSLPPAVQQTLFGVAAGLVLASEGVHGLAERFKLQVSLMKTPQGQLALSLVPSPKTNDVAGQLTGELRIPIDEKGQVEVKGQVRTDGNAQFAAGLKLALGASTFTLAGTTANQPAGQLAAKLSIPLDPRTKLDLGVSGLNAPLGVQAGVSGQGWSANGQINASGAWAIQGQLHLSL